MEIARGLALTFLLGGATGVAGQLLLLAFAALGADGLALVMGILFTMGAVGCIMFIAKASDKLKGTGSSVQFVAFYGLGIAMAQAYHASRSAGAEMPQAFASTWRFFAVALVPGIVVATAFGAAMNLLA